MGVIFQNMNKKTNPCMSDESDVSGPTRRAACCVGDPSVGGSEICGEMCLNMERAKEWTSTARRWRRGEWRGGDARRETCCFGSADVVMWSEFEANAIPYLTVSDTSDMEQ